MNLREGKFLWRTSQVKRKDLPQCLTSEVIIVGAGISGATLAQSLTQAGFEVAVIDKRKPATGSTSASTAIVMYELDVPLYELSARIGRAAAEEVFRSSLRAVRNLEGLAARLAVSSCFRRPALCLASGPEGLQQIANEYRALKQAGFKVAQYDAAQIKKNYPWTAEGALYNEDAFEVDPVELTDALLLDAQRSGTYVYAADLKSANSTKRGIELQLNDNDNASCRFFGFGTIFNVALVIRPSVPSAPIKNCLRS